MTRRSWQEGHDSAWHTRTAALALVFAAIGVTSSASAHTTAGLDEPCGRFGFWRAACDEGLECDVSWKWRRWSFGSCVAIERPCGGDLPEQCRQDEYCAFEPGVCGHADEPGVCRPRPEVCPEIYAPVCGCDGVSYANECQAHAAGVAASSDGACAECTTDQDCPHGACVIEATCAGLDCPPPAPNQCSICGDGSEPLCRRAIEPCPDGQVREVVDNCFGRCVDRVSCEAQGCEYEGATYEFGEHFPASDGCNECVCAEDGSAQCTLKLCACDYADPNRSYVSRDPDECALIRFLCAPGNQPFFDDCGCGCEPVPACRVGGCSNQLCVGPDDEGVSTCEWREEYACYSSATCELQPDGACGWTPTLELQGCLSGAAAE
jgi:hypothetical protein